MVDKIWLLTVNEVWNEEPSQIVDAFRDLDKANTAFQALVSKTRTAYKEAFGEDAKFDANMCDKKLTYECWKEDDYYAYNTVITLELITVK
jgi:hypothetical protein